MRLDELTPEQREGLSTEEVIQLVSELSCDERISFSTSLTLMIRLVAYLYNESCTMRCSTVNLELVNHDYMRDKLRFQLHPTHVQMARIIGRSPVEPGRLSVEDIVHIFKLDESVKWRVHGTGKIVDGGFHVTEYPFS